ncbi:alpha-glucan family phosphorylase [Acidipila sp. EB88]|uniref:alpha-glucan family phosphorylase n=1 Tax=Acidipila sp. EB88 TaxID=2305226 RepID=UPI000F5E8C4C|nr:alpha-glucan family phosphorylase [Acidipila sp. EB88]RRA48452.1 alpha-glucan family phosphorylase [Acidipila sp. EB88]
MRKQPSFSYPDTSTSLEARVAYFSMEIAIEPEMNTYSGGLGVLAGDTLRAAADLGVPLVAVTLAHRRGYFRQLLSPDGVQTEVEQPWQVDAFTTPEAPLVWVEIEGRQVAVRALRHDIRGVTGHVVPVFLLDTDVPENAAADRTLTDRLYGGDTDYRLRQEIVLGIGGARLLLALGLEPEVFHMNEGHAALLTVALVGRTLAGRTFALAGPDDFARVREQCVFTTHTPVPAGHDRFSMEQARRILGADTTDMLERAGGAHEGMLNMTYVALRFSRFVNGVAMQHGIVSQAMFPGYQIDAITNGVHAGTWASKPFLELFDKHLPRWRRDNVTLRYAIDIPEVEIVKAHREAKQLLVDAVMDRTGETLKTDVFTIGFARRAATYKRMDLLFTDAERLVAIAKKFGGLQVLYAGKAHPADEPGKSKIHRVIELAHELSGGLLKILYIENYEWKLGGLLTSGVDLWLNTPKRPYEASGTSGMKAALNGVPSLSILDGWWIEGWIEGVTGWAIADLEEEAHEAESLYTQLDEVILPLYQDDKEQWQRVMRSSIALNGSFFNTQRMVEQYALNAYFPQELATEDLETLASASH